jgi:hypothetical protein
MSSPGPAKPRFEPLSRWTRLALVLAGIVLTQAILYGPSLLGRRIMLPLDVLAQPGVYLPRTPEIAKIVPHDIVVSDLIYAYETARRFVHSEISAGRLPLWLPYEYCGSPNIWAWFSPFMVLAWSTASPAIWAWVHLFEAIVAGVGAYLFFRRALGLGFWASAVPAWCYPLTGFFVFWLGNSTSGAAFWLPWLLLAVDRVARKSDARGIAGVAVGTLLVLISGNLDVGGQCLLAAGLFGLWRSIDVYRKTRVVAQTRRVLLFLALGWSLGFMLAAPYWLPVLEYSRAGTRLALRSAGTEERRPGGLSALPQIVVPDMHGATRAGSIWLGGGNQVESSAAAYAGLIATLLVAPLAWCSRRHRSFNLCAAALIVLSLAWCLNLPGLVSVLRLPWLNMMSHNRLVFVGAFFILCHAAIGLEMLRGGAVARRKWFWIPAATVAVLGGWCVYRMTSLPEPIGTQLVAAIRSGQRLNWISTLEDAANVQAWFVRAFGAAALLCMMAGTGWFWLLRGKRWSEPMFAVLGALMLVDMIWFAYGRVAQTDPRLYFPQLPLFDELAKAPAGRILGYGCLPATLAQTVGLPDVRGYDGVDPAAYVSLLDLAAAPGVSRYEYARTQWFPPRVNIGLPNKLVLPPVLNLLGVRYMIFRGDPPPQLTPPFRSFDYWALVNDAALPRVFVPRRVEIEANDTLRLQKLGAPDFDPQAVAYAERLVELPAASAGVAKITAEVPTRITVTAQMETPGLIVLADRWDKGWAAYLNGSDVPILRVNHALRGVVAPAGESTIEFRYEPASFAWGLKFALLAAVTLGAMLAWERRRVGARGPSKADR